jgi:type III restriction enzyme
MSKPFFDRPILNSPYEYPRRHWELDEAGQPTQKIIENRRSAKFITRSALPGTLQGCVGRVARAEGERKAIGEPLKLT